MNLRRLNSLFTFSTLVTSAATLAGCAVDAQPEGSTPASEEALTFPRRKVSCTAQPANIGTSWTQRTSSSGLGFALPVFSTGLNMCASVVAEIDDLPNAPVVVDITEEQIVLLPELRTPAEGDVLDYTVYGLPRCTLPCVDPTWSTLGSGEVVGISFRDPSEKLHNYLPDAHVSVPAGYAKVLVAVRLKNSSGTELQARVQVSS
jgi:hypothetical protein